MNRKLLEGRLGKVLNLRREGEPTIYFKGWEKSPNDKFHARGLMAA